MGCYGFQFTLSAQPLTRSREGLFASALWLTKHRNGAPQIYVACLHSSFLNQNNESSSGTLKALPGSSHLAFCIQYISLGNPDPLLADDYCWLLLALGRKEGEGRNSGGLTYTFPL